MNKFSFTSPHIRNSIVLLIVFVLVTFAYLPSLQNDFVFWDDDVHLYENVTVRSLDAEHIKAIFTGTVNKLYIPLTSLSFAIEHHFFGYEPFVYHFNNLLLHLAVTGLIFWLGLRLGLSLTASTVAALLFGIHPMHVESVAWVTERKDVLYSIFYAASLISYTYYLNFTKSTPSVKNEQLYRYLVLAVFFGVLSMLAKPMALSLPLIMLLLDWFHNRTIDRRALLEKIPLCVLIAAMTWVSYVAHARIPGKGIIEGILVWLWTFLFYIRHFLFPVFLSPIYNLPKPIAISNPEYFLTVITVTLLIYAIYRFRNYRWFILAIAFYFFSVFFLLRYDEGKDANIVADRFMYLPSAGICFLFGYVIQQLLDCRERIYAFPTYTVLIILTIVFSVQTNRQCRIWHDSITLWTHALKYYPNERIALNNLAAALREQDEYKKAEEVYKKFIEVKAKDPSIELSSEAIRSIQKVNYVMGLYAKAIKEEPNFMDSHYNIGRLYGDIGRIPEAVAAYKKTLELDHTYKDAHFSLGELYHQSGDYQQAIYAFDQTIDLNPEDKDVYIEVISAYNKALKENPENALYQQARAKVMDGFTQFIGTKPAQMTSYFNLGSLYAGMGDYARAVSAYQMVLDINPNHSNALYNIGNIYRDQGRLSDAIIMYQKAIKANVNNADAHVSMGAVYQRQGKRKQAKESFQKAIKADSKNARAYYNLGAVEESTGNIQKAMDLYQKSIKFDPKSPVAHYNLGNVYAKLTKNSEAISSYLKAVEADFKYMDAWVNLSILSFKEGDYDNAVKYCDEAVLLGYSPPKGYLNALARYR